MGRCISIDAPNGRPSFNAGVVVDSAGKIVRAAPILRKFVGQPAANLVKWADRLGFKVEWPPRKAR